MFSSQRTSFNPLILEEGEEYFTDCSASFYQIEAPETPEDEHGNVPQETKGRLRLGSKSLVFEPDLVTQPIIKFPLRRITRVKENPSHSPAPIPSANSAPPGPAFTFGTLWTTMTSQWSASGGAGGGGGSGGGGKGGGEKRNVQGGMTRQESGEALEQFAVVATETVLVPTVSVGGETRCVSPYSITKHPAPSEYVFRVLYASASPIFTLTMELWQASKLEMEDAQSIIQDRLRIFTRGLQFDVSRLDHRETLLTHKHYWVYQIKPLLRHRGMLQLTTDAVYFQPQPNFSNRPFTRIPLKAILHIFRRTYATRRIALEVISDVTAPGVGVGGGGGGLASSLSNSNALFLAFETPSEREAVAALLQQQVPNAFQLQQSDAYLQKMTRLWQGGHISNFHYLDFLNSAAGRSRNDFSQYPIMPWVLSDYESPELNLDVDASFRDLSKPIGALNEQRLKDLVARMEDLPPDEQFLYGTHYSTPAYVVYWLVRLLPECQLRLHGGRFDAWPRMFHSVSNSWRAALSHQASFFAELMPDFYQRDPEFLLNQLKVTTHEGALGDVELPPWARSPLDFLVKMRAALESEHVSHHLPLWIDLIFGYRQRGEEARKAHNLFHPLTYAEPEPEGVLPTSQQKDSQKEPGSPTPALGGRSHVSQAALETQVQEFGQTPQQLFRDPHPPRLHCPQWKPADLLTSPTESEPWFIKLRRDKIHQHAPAPTSTPTSTTTPGPPVFPSPVPSSLSARMHSRMASSPPSSTHPRPSSANAAWSARTSPREHRERERETDRERESEGHTAAPESEEARGGGGGGLVGVCGAVHRRTLQGVCRSLTGLAVDDCHASVIDGTGCLRVWQQTDADDPSSFASSSSSMANGPGPPSVQSFVLAQLPLSSVISLPIGRPSLLAIGAFDGALVLFNPTSGSTVAKQLTHADTLRCLATDLSSGSGGQTSTSTHTLVSGSADQTVRVWAVTPSALRHLQALDDHQEEVTCVGVCGNTVVSAASDGTLVMWDPRCQEGPLFSASHEAAVVHCDIREHRAMSISEDGDTRLWDIRAAASGGGAGAGGGGGEVMSMARGSSLPPNAKTSSSRIKCATSDGWGTALVGGHVQIEGQSHPYAALWDVPQQRELHRWSFDDSTPALRCIDFLSAWPTHGTTTTEGGSPGTVYDDPTGLAGEYLRTTTQQPRLSPSLLVGERQSGAIALFSVVRSHAAVVDSR
ncbi:unnamed protein product [Vitrella brassicaformis CCMP3155]|uniref:BEACH domain-containing protein n=1 Tax=Vitrella brassicaformis (strain CCMP3155) TaxID=1169540 RepID=A0A0G4ERT7_VITBC|nr:unnamed protein product [Vitrella brassicaformis CCMP3155]|eukprot:CEM00607.1 unnamed protein product [Vitrella brassicaformis CCMP3155]